MNGLDIGLMPIQNIFGKWFGQFCSASFANLATFLQNFGPTDLAARVVLLLCDVGKKVIIETYDFSKDFSKDSHGSLALRATLGSGALWGIKNNFV